MEKKEIGKLLDRQELRKEKQEVCKECQLGDTLENCRICLLNLFKEYDKHPPFSE